MVRPRWPPPLFLLLRLLLALFITPLSSAYTTLSDDTLNKLPSSGSDFDINNGRLLSPILIPRVPGTPGSTAVLNHFAAFFRDTLPKWTVEYQNSTSKTPATGAREVPFVNLIATRDPPWASEGEVGRLTLVAHYDSKLKPDGFIGATDSAAPCAMIMHAARSVDDALTRKWAAMEAEGVGSDGFGGFEEEKGLQILFLDGEEAFVNWNDNDSLYGSRSLAETWEQSLHPALSTYRNRLSSISLFLLLDLLGAASPSVPSYYRTTHWAYKHLAALESRLRSLQLFHSSPNHPSKQRPRSARAEPVFFPDAHKYDTDIPQGRRQFMIQDDHLPFLVRGVEVLHLIPSRFPSVWHKMTDDGAHLDMDTVEDWARLMSAFVAEWMDLDAFMAATPSPPPPTKAPHPVRSKTEL